MDTPMVDYYSYYLALPVRHKFSSCFMGLKNLIKMFQDVSLSSHLIDRPLIFFAMVLFVLSLFSRRVPISDPNFNCSKLSHVTKLVSN